MSRLHCSICFSAERIYFVNSQVGDHLIVKQTSILLSQLPLDVDSEEQGSVAARWGREGQDVYVQHSKPVKQVCWHTRGDYVATVAGDGKIVIIEVHVASMSQSYFNSIWKCGVHSSTF